MATPMDRLELGDLTVRIDEGEADLLRLTWEGMSNSRDPGQALRPFFAIVSARAAERKAVVEHRLEHLRALNSSTIAVLIQLLREGEQRGLRQRLVYDSSLRWQAVSLDPLRSLFTREGGVEFVRLHADRLPNERSGPREGPPG